MGWSTASLISAALLAFQVGLSTVPQYFIFGALLSLAIGGFTTLLGGSASISVGKWFKASGSIAVVLFVLMLLLQATGVIKKPPSLSLIITTQIAEMVSPLISQEQKLN